MGILDGKLQSIHQNINPSVRKAAVFNGMAIAQSMGKPKGVKTCDDLANEFIRIIIPYVEKYQEVHLIFERYDVECSLKMATREQRSEGVSPVSIHIRGVTSIANIAAMQVLSSSKNKDELTVFSARTYMAQYKDSGSTFVVICRNDMFFNTGDYDHLKSSQEEADTRTLLHSIDIAARDSDVKLDIVSPDTDELVLAVNNYPQLCKQTLFVPHSPSAFHALKGADKTGKFSGKANYHGGRCMQRHQRKHMMPLYLWEVKLKAVQQNLFLSHLSARSIFQEQILQVYPVYVGISSLRSKQKDRYYPPNQELP